MLRSASHSGKPLPQPLWLRLLALFAVLLISGASTLQASHVHDEDLRGGQSSQHSVPGPEHCPLCMAMHSAMPAAQHHAPDLVFALQEVAVSRRRAYRPRRWSYEMFSRPPPARERSTMNSPGGKEAV